MSSVYEEFAKTEKEEMKNYFKPKKIEFYRNQTIYEFFVINKNQSNTSDSCDNMS